MYPCEHDLHCYWCTQFFNGYRDPVHADADPVATAGFEPKESTAYQHVHARWIVSFRLAWTLGRVRRLKR